MGRKKASQKRERVTAGNVSLPLWRHAKGWRFAWKEDDGTWRYGTRSSRKSAVSAAFAKGMEISSGRADLYAAIKDADTAALLRRMLEMDITHADLDRLAAVRGGMNQVALSDAIGQFLAAKTAARGPSARNLRTLRGTLDSLLTHFAPADPPIHSVTPEEIEEWMTHGEVTPRTRRNRRAVAVTFWRWCRSRRLLLDETTAAERTERPIVRRGIPATWTPAELQTLFDACPESHLCWLTLSAWAGIRAEELYQEFEESTKDVLRWDDIQAKHIEIRPVVAKTGDRRLIPIVPALRSVLSSEKRRNPARVKNNDPVCRGRPPSRKVKGINRPVTLILGDAVGGWKANALRHSFISYRAALVGLAKTAMEAGNSESEARKSYHDAMPEEVAKAWFAPITKKK